ncbi:hypothetical protein DFP93_10318 [Aneurinibacillus soli]|uniref:Uncharacterized protein n=1 Tax=Aneurinibacillus soli TaxID=1500254 RepID=A0A0U4WKY3_9BACL|nr:hypothetical protein [Aneurinibacillus soli]PYE62811.1 hypothetical protein DFP93_10318 [Aneurinibacillus soli]BAU29131.1 hypothetical protein CB4_03309 [Aneurinibacillus soli]
MIEASFFGYWFYPECGGGAEMEVALSLGYAYGEAETDRSRRQANSPTNEERGSLFTEALWAKARSPTPFR